MSSVVGHALIAACLFGSGHAAAQTEEIPVRVQNVFTLITTDRLYESRDFYVRHFGFAVAFQSSIYIQLTIPSEGGGSFDLAFMPPDNPFGQSYREVFNGRGAYLTIEVADAAAVYDRLQAEGAPIIGELTDEAWGQRHFLMRDPGGVTIDIVQSIDPAPGYYDQYQVAR